MRSLLHGRLAVPPSPLLDRPTRVALLAGLGLLLLAPAASARAPVRLVYKAPEGCPAVSEFVASVTSRGAPWREAAPHEEATLVEVSLLSRDAGFTGVLRTREPGAAADQREVQGERCAEVAEALASVLVLALREAPAAEPVPVAAASSAPPPAAPAPPTPPAEEAEAGFKTSWEAGNKTVGVSAGSLKFQREVSLSLSTGFATGFVPGQAIPRHDLALERASFVTTPDRETYMVGPIFRMRLSLLGEGGFHSLGEDAHRSPGGTARPVGMAYGLGVCSSPLHDSRGLSLLLCSEVAAYLMRFRTVDALTARSRSESMGWASVGLSAHARYAFGGRFFAGLSLGAEARLSEIMVRTGEGRELYSPSLVGVSALLGAGVRF